MRNEQNTANGDGFAWPEGPGVPGEYDGTYEQPLPRPIPRGAGALGALTSPKAVELVQ